MIVRGLWGIEIEALKKYSFLSDASFRISMASLNSFDDPKRTSVFISFQGKEFKLCSLIPEKIEQQVIDITCLEGEEIVFRSEGPNCIHLTGNYVSLYESDSEDGDESTDDVSLMAKKSKERYVQEFSPASERSLSVEYDQTYTDLNEHFDMPIIHEYLDKSIRHTAPTTTSFNRLNTIHNIPQDVDISSFAIQNALKNSRKISDSESSQSETESDKEEREIIIIPSEQTSDIGSDHEDSSAVESNYQSCNEESKEKEEDSDTIEAGIQNITKDEILSKDVEHNTTESESPPTKKKPTPKLEQPAKNNKTTSTNMAKKEKAKVAATAKSKKNSPKANPTPGPNKANSTKKSQQDAGKKAEKSNTVSNNNAKKDTATKNNSKKNASTNNTVKKSATTSNNNKTKNEDTSKNNKTVSKKTTTKSNTKPNNANSNPPTTKAAKDELKNSTLQQSEDDLIKRYPKRRRAPDDEKELEITIEKDDGIESRQTSVETEDRYPKRKRTPNYEQNLELMAAEDAKMEAVVRNSNSNRKRKRRTKQSSPLS